MQKTAPYTNTAIRFPMSTEMKSETAPDLCTSRPNTRPTDSPAQHETISLDLLLANAKTRWLKASEIEYLLDPENTPLPVLSTTPPCRPPSGTVLLFDRNATRNYKEDGYAWIKKRNSSKVREDHVKLRIKGEYRVAGIYRHCCNPLSFHRRAYHILDPKTGVTKSPVVRPKDMIESDTEAESKASLVLVQYLDTEKAAERALRAVDSAKWEKKQRKSVRKRRYDTTTALVTKKLETGIVSNLEVPPSLPSTKMDFLEHYNWNKYSLPSKPVLLSSVPNVSLRNKVSPYQCTKANMTADFPISMHQIYKPQIKVEGYSWDPVPLPADDECLDDLWDLIMENDDDLAEKNINESSISQLLTGLEANEYNGLWDCMDTLFD